MKSQNWGCPFWKDESAKQDNVTKKLVSTLNMHPAKVYKYIWGMWGKDTPAFSQQLNNEDQIVQNKR